jgi:hypothetical protein
MSKQRTQRFYIQGIPLPAPSVDLEPEPDVGESDDDARPEVANSNRMAAKAPPSRIQSDSNRLLKHWLSGANLFEIQSVILDSGGIRSGGKGNRVRRNLEDRGMIRVHKIQRGKGNVAIWEPTDRAYEAAGIEKPPVRTKGGGYVHSFCAYHISRWHQQQGYNVELERFLPLNGKAVDLVCRSGDRTVFVEVAVSPPLGKEIGNVIKDLAGGLKPDQLILAVMNANARKTLSKLIGKDTQLTPFRKLIQVKLAGDFVDTGRHQ